MIALIERSPYWIAFSRRWTVWRKKRRQTRPDAAYSRKEEVWLCSERDPTPPSPFARIATAIGTALIFFVILAACACAIWLGRAALLHPWFQTYHILLWLALVVATLQVVVFRGNFRRLSWEKLGDLWLKPPGVAFTVSGALVLADMFTGKQAISSAYANKTLILSIAGVAGGALLAACLLNLVGRSLAADKSQRDPLLWFIPAFSFAFIATAGFFTVAINNAFLTLVVVAQST